MQQENITLGKEKIKKPRTKQERLSAGETFVTSEKGNSMTPLIMSGQKHVLENQLKIQRLFRPEI